MHDVTWRTACTLAILMLLVLLGSGRLVEAPRPAPTPWPTGAAMSSANFEVGLSTPQAGAVLLAGSEAAPDLGRQAIRVPLARRQRGTQGQVWW